MISTPIKQQIVTELKKLEKLNGLSAKRFANSIDIDPAQWSRLKKGEFEGVLADAKFITLARKNNIVLGDAPVLKTVKTATFQYIYSLLETSHKQCISTLFVDRADIGKSHVCKYYAQHVKNAIYIDCSQVKTKQLYVREIASKLGLSLNGKYADIYKDLVYYLNTLDPTIIILDEAGDLQYDAFLENKALWNATEGNVAWFMIGADGLKEKIKRAITNKKVGYSEMFRRYGGQYRTVTPQGDADVKNPSVQPLKNFLNEQVALFLKANAPEGADIQKLVKSSRGSLTVASNLIRVMNQKRSA